MTRAQQYPGWRRAGAGESHRNGRVPASVPHAKLSRADASSFPRPGNYTSRVWDYSSTIQSSDDLPAVQGSSSFSLKGELALSRVPWTLLTSSYLVGIGALPPHLCCQEGWATTRRSLRMCCDTGLGVREVRTHDTLYTPPPQTSPGCFHQAPGLPTAESLLNLVTQ